MRPFLFEEEELTYEKKNILDRIVISVRISAAPHDDRSDDRYIRFSGSREMYKSSLGIRTLARASSYRVVFLCAYIYVYVYTETSLLSRSSSLRSVASDRFPRN